MDGILSTSLQELYKKPLSSKFNYAIGSGVLDNTPYLLVDTMYNVGEGDEKVTGILKGLSAETGQTLQVCVHNEVGYRQTFFLVFESFIEAMKEGKDDASFYEIILQANFNDIPVGYSREKLTKDSDGDVEIRVDSAFLIPADGSSISRSDSQTNSWSSPDGSLINANAYTIENSVLSSSLSLNYQDEKWRVNGQIQAKEVSYELDYSDWLLTEYGIYLAVSDLLKSSGTSSDYRMWLPDADPSTAMSFSIEKIVNNPDANLKMNMGPINMNLLVDDFGVIDNATMAIGPVNMKLNQVFVKGKPLLP